MLCTEELVDSMECYVTLTGRMDLIPRAHSARYILQLKFMSVRFKTRLKEQIVWLENIWEQPKQIKILFRKKLRAY